jgi:serine protease Do
MPTPGVLERASGRIDAHLVAQTARPREDPVMTRYTHQPFSSHRGASPATRGRSTGRRPSRRVLVAAGLAGAAGIGVFAAGGPAVADQPSDSTGTAFSPAAVEQSVVHLGIDYTGYVGIPARSGLSWSDPVTVHFSCTGWFASERGDIVTAGHCVDPNGPEIRRSILAKFLRDQDLPQSTPGVQNWRVEGQDSALPDRDAVTVVQPFAFGDRLIEEPTVVQVLDFQPFEHGDLALLQVSGLGVPTPALAVTADAPSPGDPVTAVGYPGNVEDQSDASRLRASFKSGSISSANVSTEGVPSWEINAEIGSGMSGGPTVDAHGDVVGVNSRGFEEEQNFNFITDTTALRSFLDQHHVSAPAATPGDPQALQDGGAEGLDPASASALAPATDGDGSLLPYAAAGALLLLGAGGAYQHTRRRPAGPAPRELPGGADATRLAVRLPFSPAPRPDGRPVSGQVIGTPRAAQATCTHTGNPPAARFCQRCGSSTTR